MFFSIKSTFQRSSSQLASEYTVSGNVAGGEVEKVLLAHSLD